LQNDIAIRVSNVSKKYIIGKQKDSSFRGSFQGVFNRKSVQGDEFMALSDLNFEIKKGEVLGIIGKNGAGKSTLLKILSQITKPSTGRIEINGRVASLLEVGTGFHPELTGRENIYLNGTILGMSRKEVRSKFDEIVEFSGVEKFIDTPVKRYSSGMYVRLAFAVAAHLEPEILIIDEVLAVGDAEFQKKCLGKMKDVAGEGRTVIFVSHNITAIKSLCNKGVLLQRGKLVLAESIDLVVNKYIADTDLNSKKAINIDSEGFYLESIELEDSESIGKFNIEEDLKIRIKISSSRESTMINVNLFFKNIEGMLIFATCSQAERWITGTAYFDCVIPANTLNDIIYGIDVMIVENGEKAIIHAQDCLSIEGIEPPRNGAWLDKFPGLIRPTYYKWTKKIIR
jgi:lipopolysaccharide transport system ATP-binding protein